MIKSPPLLRGTFCMIKETFLHLSPHVGRKVPKEAPRKGSTHGTPLTDPLPSSALIFAPRKCLRAVKSALCPVPATGSERHPSRSTCWVATRGYERKGWHARLGRPPRLAITKRLARLLPAKQFRRLPASAALRRGCGSATDYQLNSAFAVPERVSSAQTREGEASARQGRWIPKEETVGFFLGRRLFWYFSPTRGEKYNKYPKKIYISPVHENFTSSPNTRGLIFLYIYVIIN